MQAKTIWIWVKILMVLGGLIAFLITSVVLYYQYNNVFGDEDEGLKPKELTTAMIQDNSAYSQKASAFLTRVMEREKTLDSVLDSFDQIKGEASKA
jgi:hypothetical protein